MQFKVKAFTGPVAVKEYADRLRSAGFTDVEEGTEHVYATSDGSEAGAAAWNAQVDAERAGIHSLTFRPR